MYKSVFGKTQKATLKMLHQMIDTYRDVDLTEDSRMTLGEWLDKWLDEYMIFTVRESTLDGFRCMTNNQVKRFIGDKQLSSLTTADIQKFYNKIKKQGRVKPNRDGSYELADSMVRGIHMMLHEALDTAVKERLIAKNPTNGTTIPKNNYAEKQILGDEQLTRFLEEIKGEEYWYDFFYLEVMTGLRRGEICGLKWSDIDFGANKLRVQRSVSSKKGGGVNIGETKTNTGTRNIIMPPSVMDALRKRKQTAISAWVFPAFLNPEQPIHPEAAYRKLKVILKHAGLPQIRFHDLRHTFATHAMKGGVDAKTLSGILGHTNASFTLDTYTHVTSDMQRNASAVVGNMMKNIMIKE
jgi:integrase